MAFVESAGLRVDGVDTDVHFTTAPRPGVVEHEVQQAGAGAGIAQRRADMEFFEIGQWTITVRGGPEVSIAKPVGVGVESCVELPQQAPHARSVLDGCDDDSRDRTLARGLGARQGQH